MPLKVTMLLRDEV